MGFPTRFVDTADEIAAREFTCSVCQEMVLEPLVACSHQHVFCAECLHGWLDAKNGEALPSCPNCNEALQTKAVKPLRVAAPIADRILSRVRCRCPLTDQGCDWRGEYSEVSAHLTNTASHRSPVVPQGTAKSTEAAKKTAIDTAEALKEQGNTLFGAGRYREAMNLYTKAISVAPDVATYYANRAAAWLRCGVTKEAIADCRSAIKLDPKFAKAHVRLASAMVQCGDFKEALEHLDGCTREATYIPTKEGVDIVKVHTEDTTPYFTIRMPDGSERQTTEEKLEISQASASLVQEWEKVKQLAGMHDAATAALAAEEYKKASSLLGVLLSQTRAAPVLLAAARAETQLGRCDAALRFTREVIKADATNVDAYAVRGEALFFSADFEQASVHAKEGLRLDPDHAASRTLFKKVRNVQRLMQTAKKASDHREFDAAVEALSEAITASALPTHAPLTARIHSDRATAYLRLQQYERCLQDCAVAIYAEDDHKAAWVTKANALHALNRHEEALNDMESLLRVYENDHLVRHQYEKAQKEVRKMKRPKYYDILGVPTVASEMEIKNAYKKRVQECHPDKFAAAPPEEQKKAEQEFKSLGEALEILGDAMRRQLYDEGYDKDAIEERVTRAQRAARESDHHHRHHR